MAPPRGQRFYRSRAFGSEAQFNPFSLIINGGFDQLRTANAKRQVFELGYDVAARGLWKSVRNPDATIRGYGGYGLWARKQLLPFSGKSSGGGQWVPNYQLHLFGGGMTGVRVTEWFQQHGTSHPELAAAATVATWHLLTEMIENQGGIRSADAMTDLLLFDPAAFLLWRNDWIQRVFSTNVEMTNWSGQPAIAAPTSTIQNMHQTAMMRISTRFSRSYRPMVTFGGSFLFGLSRRQGVADWVSLGAGWDPTENPIIDPITGERTVTLNPNVGVFYDRDGSLLASAILRANRTEVFVMNVYPGVVKIFDWSPGLWAHLLSDGRFRLGITPRFGLGVGYDQRK